MAGTKSTKKRCRTKTKTVIRVKKNGRRVKVKRKVRVCKPVKVQKPSTTAPSPVPVGEPPTPTPVAVPPAPDAPPPPPPSEELRTIVSPIAVYTGPVGRREAERLLWRAGFGPRPGQAEALAQMGLEQAVLSLTRPTGSAQLEGPAPMVDGDVLYPDSAWGHDLLFWMDRMVRSTDQFGERLALILHDWFATSSFEISSNLLLAQTDLFRSHGRGSFHTLVVEITRNPAMLVWLSGINNNRWGVNENYARELMELFTLGADRGAYSEADVRQLARALTGWRANWGATGFENFRFDQNFWDPGQKTVFGRTGVFNWQHAVDLVIDHPLHPSFFVSKLWSYFTTEPLTFEEASALERLYVDRGRSIRAVAEAMLCSPKVITGARMVKPPVVLAAGMLRALGRGIDRMDWVWLTDAAGQRIYQPPDVSGWDDERWMDTSTARARWDLVVEALRGVTIPNSQWSAHPAETAEQAVERARATWGDPPLTEAGVGELVRFAQTCVPASPGASRRAQRRNALLHLIAASPDYQTS